MRYDPDDLGPEVLEFLTERHLATLSLVVSADEVHASPVGITWDDDRGLIRIITWSGAKKTRLLEAGGSLPAAVTQVDGGRWLSLHGRAVVTGDADRAAEAVRRYAQRYRPPKDRGADRRVIEITVERIVGRVPTPS